VRSAPAVACALAAALVATASISEAHTSKPKPACHRRHQRRVCRTGHVKPRRRVTTTTTTTTSSGSTTPATSNTTGGSTSTSTTAVQTTTTQTTTSSSTSAALPHGTEVDERATGQQSPFYAIDAYQRTLAAGTIRFNIYNYDQDPHTLAVADSGGQQLTDAVPVPAGHTGTAVTLTVSLPPGTYVLFCTLPQHAAAGMKTTIVVK
jgi:plastocyanin